MAAKYGARSACNKGFGAMPAKADRIVAVGQHETEHHLYAKQQRMKIPYDCRLVQQGNVVGRRISTKSRHTLLHEPSGIVIQHIVVLLIEETVYLGKSP